MYAKHLRAITVDFALNVRKSPFPIARMREEDPELHAAFLKAAAAISGIQPMPQSTREVLRRFFNGFEVSQVSGKCAAWAHAKPARDAPLLSSIYSLQLPPLR